MRSMGNLVGFPEGSVKNCQSNRILFILWMRFQPIHPLFSGASCRYSTNYIPNHNTFLCGVRKFFPRKCQSFSTPQLFRNTGGENTILSFIYFFRLPWNHNDLTLGELKRTQREGQIAAAEVNDSACFLIPGRN